MVNNKIKKQNKSGFSLAEALVSMLILSVFFIATAKVITTKQPAGKIAITHGFYECYRDSSGELKQTSSDDLVIKRNEGVEQCAFYPSKHLPNVVQYYIKSNDEEKVYYAKLHPYLDPEKDFIILGKLNGYVPSNDFLKEEEFKNTEVSKSAESSESSEESEESETSEENIDYIKNLANYLKNAYPESIVAKKLDKNENVEAFFIAW